jgi:hypothetical protein
MIENEYYSDIMIKYLRKGFDTNISATKQELLLHKLR